MTARALALLLVAAAVACALRVAPPRAAGPSLVVVSAGSRRPATDLPVVFVEIAATPESRGRGLGGRERLPPDSGMLFVYPGEQMRSFWMKDCLVALDIAFIDRDRRITNVATLPPGAGLPEGTVPNAGSTRPARYVLETASGWLAEHGVGAGDLVDLSAALDGVRPQ